MLNSAWFSKIKDVTGTLWMGLPQLKVMDANNQLANDEDGYLTIGVMHHPSEWLAYDEIHGCGGRRTSYQYFAQKTHLILSGHVHALPEKSKEATSGSKTRVITGGSTYAGNEYNNHCSIININLESNIMRRALVEYKSNTGEWKINYGYEDSIKIRD